MRSRVSSAASPEAKAIPVEPARPVPLGVKASMTITNTLRTIDSKNVVARLDGRDRKLKSEYVVYSAHWDHLGVGAAVDGDTIYNGAKDNAVGVAGLIDIARAFTKLPATDTLVGRTISR